MFVYVYTHTHIYKGSPFNALIKLQWKNYIQIIIAFKAVAPPLVSCRLTAEGREYMAAFIGQGPPMRPFDWHVKQPITVRFVQRHVSGRGNVATITDRCVKLSDVF